MMGIDLGTTYSVVALCHRGKAFAVPVDGFNITPSVVHYDPTGAVVVGREAAAKRVDFPESTIFDSKRLIGRNFSTDQVAQEEAMQLPYKVQGARNGSIELPLPDGQGTHTPQTVGARILRRLKHAAETSTPWRRVSGHKFTSATVSVPVEFTLEQRAATVRAGEAAGFRMVRILDEPVAAAIAFGLHRGTSERTVLVYDMGGGTLDVALLLLELQTRTFLVLGAKGDPHLGGEDFDRALAAHLAGKPSDQHDSLDPALLRAVELAKRELSHHISASVQLPNQPDLVISRNMMEEVCAELIQRAMEPVYQVLHETGTSPEEVDDVVMVGGSSRLVAIRQKLNIFFDGKLRTNDVDPDTAIAIGSALSFGC
eukprot:CAMPEP_0114227524 /NCGR_PEP_ID=MMETSP0058-20121206/1839_1 /TAXON_ID=36894 /ORGANISM="Pyramimonas parkeae, CCMP726" /LENGTH=369 /DNA_ID=CAMNT_0001338377 /DNA_START=384 /DNA_END=1493 /DNA_ORIENTATION=+